MSDLLSYTTDAKRDHPRRLLAPGGNKDIGCEGKGMGVARSAQQGESLYRYW